VVSEILGAEQCRGHGWSVGRYYSAFTAAFVFATMFAMSGCSSDSSGPDPVNVSFRAQPSDTEAGSPIVPAIEVATNSESPRTVTISIADNDCGATLAGDPIQTTVNGTAVFSGLTVDLPAEDFQLEARVQDQSTRSAPFDVLVPDIGGPFDQHPTLCLRGRSQTADAASLAWAAHDDLLWTADDNTNQVCGFDRRSGLCADPVTRDELLTAFPAAADCDDGDGNPATSCSFVDELEVVAYDDVGGFIYVFNTVNDAGSTVVVDRPAVFRLRPGACRGCVSYDAWQELPEGYTYRGAVAVEGRLYISSGPNLHRYDFDSNSVIEEPVLSLTGWIITGLSEWDGLLYVLLGSRTLITVDWDTGMMDGDYDLTPFGVRNASGVEIVRDSIYVLEGDPTNPVFLLTVDLNQP